MCSWRRRRLVTPSLGSQAHSQFARGKNGRSNLDTTATRDATRHRCDDSWTDVDQGGLEQVSRADRIASLTGIRAVAALLVMGTHAAYGTGELQPRLSRAHLLAPGDRCRDLLRAVRSAAVRSVGAGERDRGSPASSAALCLEPGQTHHARLRGHRPARLHRVPLPLRPARTPATPGKAWFAISP